MPPDSFPSDAEDVRVLPDDLPGRLSVPAGAHGLVIFAHGSGSGRDSPRNRHVAAGLRQARLATLLLDLLTPQEAGQREKALDTPLLAQRLLAASRWARTHPGTASLRQGYFGGSTGAGAALLAAGRPGSEIAAVVSRGGRVDLAGMALAGVRAPTLLLVGGLDRAVVDINMTAMEHMDCERKLSIVPGAGHLFEEHGAMDVVVDQAAAWFARWLPA